MHKIVHFTWGMGHSDSGKSGAKSDVRERSDFSCYHKKLEISSSVSSWGSKEAVAVWTHTVKVGIKTTLTPDQTACLNATLTILLPNYRRRHKNKSYENKIDNSFFSHEVKLDKELKTIYKETCLSKVTSIQRCPFFTQ